jgi:hypothetical protein
MVSSCLDDRVRQGSFIHPPESSTTPHIADAYCCLQDIFFEKHGVKLGLKSAFVKAALSTLLSPVQHLHSTDADCCLQDIFFEGHGVKLGLMSAFVKAANQPP